MNIMQRFLGGVAFGAISVGKATGLVYENAGAPTNGTNGTFANVAGPGKLLVDTTNKVLYQNTNTLLSPTWTALTTSTGAGTYTGTFDGVIGGNTPADGKFTTVEVSGLITGSAVNGLTASTTQTQVGALALTKQVNVVGTVANTGDAVKLAALAVGEWQDVYNDGAHPASVFPATGGNIDGAGANVAVTLTNAKRCRYTCVATNVIESAQLGVVSA